MDTVKSANGLMPFTKIIAILSAIGLFIVIFVPIWRIELDAPQYPEGLVMQIFSYKLAGDVQIINGLNHYIGMRTLHADDFVEFTVLPYIVGLIALSGILTVLVNRKWFFYTWAGIFILFAVLAMVDFYIWEYNYGHNLDPAAPIQVPGMAYQPPLIGFKQLLNFGAFSIPDTGGWILLGVGILLVIASFLEIKQHRMHLKIKQRTAAGVAILFISFLASCSSGPAPIHFGVDNCDFCKMTISDPRFGAELITQKGKVYKFDDIHCVKGFLDEDSKRKTQMKALYFIDFAHPEHFVPQDNSFLLHSEALHSPMGSNLAAFATQDSLMQYQSKLSGKEITWEDYASSSPD